MQQSVDLKALAPLLYDDAISEILVDNRLEVRVTFRGDPFATLVDLPEVKIELEELRDIISDFRRTYKIEDSLPLFKITDFHGATAYIVQIDSKLSGYSSLSINIRK